MVDPSSNRWYSGRWIATTTLPSWLPEQQHPAVKVPTTPMAGPLVQTSFR